MVRARACRVYACVRVCVRRRRTPGQSGDLIQSVHAFLPPTPPHPRRLNTRAPTCSSSARPASSRTRCGAAKRFSKRCSSAVTARMRSALAARSSTGPNVRCALLSTCGSTQAGRESTGTQHRQACPWTAPPAELQGYMLFARAMRPTRSQGKRPSLRVPLSTTCSAALPPPPPPARCIPHRTHLLQGLEHAVGAHPDLLLLAGPAARRRARPCAAPRWRRRRCRGRSAGRASGCPRGGTPRGLLLRRPLQQHLAQLGVDVVDGVLAADEALKVVADELQAAAGSMGHAACSMARCG